MADELANAVDPVEYESEMLARAIFAEDAGGGEEVWRAFGDTMFNRVDLGKREWGKTLEDVLRTGLTSVRTNSKQYQIASNPAGMNEVEERVYQDILGVSRGLVRSRKDGSWKSSVGGATHFEHTGRYGIPEYVTKSPKAKATKVFPKRFGLTFWEGIE